MLFADRVEAGRGLGVRLAGLRGEDVVVVGLPRGGVPVAYEVAVALGAPLDVVVVRKLGVPFQPELGMGAIGEQGVSIVNDQIVKAVGVKPDELAWVERKERHELERRIQRFRGARPRVPLEGRTVVVVDDGFATGATMRAACQAVRALGAERVVAAVPVAPPQWAVGLRYVSDDQVCLATPAPFYSIGEWYEDFAPTTDDEVVELLERRATSLLAGRSGARDDDPPLCDLEVVVQVDDVRLSGRLTVPEDAVEVVVFAHGSGSSRYSPRNRYVAQALQQVGLGTLLCDLLSPDEEVDRGKVFDVPLLARRLVAVTRWLGAQPETAGLPVGYFGASTGAAAALWAAAEPGVDVAAVVARGGRPDLAGPRLAGVSAPTLLIVGGDDLAVLELNREARTRLRCENRLTVVPGATHLFEEPGTLHQVATLARDWFVTHLPSAQRAAS